MEKIPFTPQGLILIKEELAHLKGTERQAVINAIAAAREHGDLSENAEYHAAREQQGLCEARIRDIEAKLGGAQIIDPMNLPQDGRVVFGVTVVIEDIDSGEQKHYKIVGEDEADVKVGKISVGSPIAKGLIGKSEGDEAKIQTPSGLAEYEIIDVLYE